MTRNPLLTAVAFGSLAAFWLAQWTVHIWQPDLPANLIVAQVGR